MSRRNKRKESKDPPTSQKILTFRAWCELNAFSAQTGYRLIKAGKVRIVRLSPRRIGIGELDNAKFQDRHARGGA